MLRLENLTKTFGETRAVADVSLHIDAGEFVTLLGPSGCGKTTTLRLIAGFEKPTGGRVLLGDREITRLPPQKRGVGMVFQNYALFPHMNVFENVAFGLKAARVPSAELARKVEDALTRVELAGFGKRKVQQLSGGQQQRVALARALAPEPPLVLLDEPLSNLDTGLREKTRAELRSLLKRLGMTAVFVTHDQDEAFALSDRIAIMNGGAVQQVGSPETLYQTPVTDFVAAFVGRANFLQARVTAAQGERLSCELAGGGHWIATPAAHTTFKTGDIGRLMVRPEALAIVARGDALPGDLGGVVAYTRFAGAQTFYHVKLLQDEVVVVGGPRVAKAGDAVQVRLREGVRVVVFATNTNA